MNIYSDIVLFAIILLVNLLLFGIFVAIGIAVTFRLIPNIKPRVYYVISVAAFLIAIFIPLTVTFQGFFNTLLVSNTAVSTKQQTFAEISTPGTNQPIVTPHIIEQEVIEQAAAPPMANLLSDFIFFTGNSLIGIFSVGLWLLISTYLLCREIIGHRKLRKSRDGWQSVDDRERKELSCPDDIKLYFADNQSPYTAGLLRPAVIFPKHFSDNLSPDAIRFIVSHEIAHARWFDPLVNAILRTFRALFWVSPGLWFLEYIAKREREAAADCAALSAVSNLNNDREATKEYAELLLSIAKVSAHNSKQSQASLTAVYFGGGSLLENRIQRVLNGYSSPTPFRAFLATAAFSAVLVGMTYIPVVSKPARSIYLELSFNEFDNKTSDGILDSIKQSFAITGNSKKISNAEKSINSAEENTKPLMLSESETDSNAAPAFKQDINSDSETKQDIVKTALPVETNQEVPDKASVSATGNATATATANVITNSTATARANEIVNPISAAIINEIAAPTAVDSTNIKPEQESKPINQGRSPDFIDEMASVGYTNLPVNQIVKLKQAGITASYVKSLRTVGLGNLSVGEITNLGFARVTSESVKKLQSIGYSNLSAGQLAEFGFHGVTPAFINSMRAAGLENLSPGELIRLRLSNVTPEFAAKARNQKKNGTFNKSDE